MVEDNPHIDPPREGYMGANTPRSGRQIRLPEWIFNLVEPGTTLHFSYHPETHFPVFSPEPGMLRDEKTEPKQWPAVDKNPVRMDDVTPVVQLPARFFSDFTSPTKVIELKPVPTEAQIEEERKLHFVVGRPSHGDSFICFLLTTPELAEADAGLLSRLFSTSRQRSKIVDNLDEADMIDGEEYVVKLFDRLTDAIREKWPSTSEDDTRNFSVIDK